MGGLIVMRFIHLGDLHLGRYLGDFDLIDDQRYMLDQIIEIIRQKSVDAVLIAGDVYDKSVPSEAAMNLLDYFLRKLAENKVKTYMISGNHDSDDRLNYGSNLFQVNDIYISSVFDGTLHRYSLTDEYGSVNVYLLPFVKASQVRHFFENDKIETYEDAVRTIIDHTNIDVNERNVIVAHQFVAGIGQNPDMGGSEGMAVQNVGLVESIGYSTFDKFDYVALGHIHSPQSIGRKEVRYAGSMLKYSLKEAHNNKSVPVVTMGEKNQIDIELVPLKPKRDVIHIQGKLKEILKNPESAENYMYITLTDEELVNNVMNIVQGVYPYTIKIDYDNSHTRAIEQDSISGLIENKSFTDIIKDFYNQIYGYDISEEEMRIMREVAMEAGVINEAD